MAAADGVAALAVGRPPKRSQLYSPKNRAGCSPGASGAGLAVAAGTSSAAECWSRSSCSSNAAGWLAVSLACSVVLA